MMENSENKLDFKISGGTLLKYALPTILSNIFMNVYSVVDQLFVSNLLGTDALSAVSIASPFLAVALAIGMMIATGGCAFVSKQMGAGNNVQARQNFTFFVLFSVGISVLLCALGIIFREPILNLMGADEALYPMCEAYVVPIFLLIPFAIPSVLFQLFFVAAGKPGLGFGLSIAGGVTNIVLDYVLIGFTPLGVAGAAYATAAGYVLQSVVGAIYFLTARKGTIHFVRPKWNGSALLKACSNGASEMVGTLSVTITMIAMNIILMNIVGSDGVAAAAIVLSAQTILSAAYYGYIQGIAPVVSFHYGKSEGSELRRIFRIALRSIAVMSVLTFAAAFPLAKPIALLFAKDSEAVVQMAVQGMFIMAAGFLLMGINLFASGFFTALNDGRISALLSFMRTLVFLIIPLLILPAVIGINGVWLSIPLAEVLSVALSVFCFRKYRRKYNYA